MTPTLGTSDSQYDFVSNMKTNCVKFFPWKSIGGTLFTVDNLATGLFSEELLFEGHSSSHTDSNDTGLEFLSRQGSEKKGSHTYIQTGRIRIL